MSFFDRLRDRVGDFIDEVTLPEEILLLHQRAQKAIRAGHYQDALKHLGEAEHRRPGVERTRHMRGLCHFHLNNMAQAKTLFEEAIELREDPSSHFYLGLIAEKEARFNDALAHFQRALTLEAHSDLEFDLHFGLGRMYLAMHRPAKASRELRRALTIWPDERGAMIALAEALRQRGRTDEALTLAEQIPHELLQESGLLTRGRIEAACQHPGQAAATFERLLERQPDHLDALLDGARAYLQLGQMARANQLLLRALGGVDGQAAAPVYALLGATNEGIDNLDKALQSYEAALQRDPNHRQALLGAGRLQLQQGDHHLAADHFDTLLALGPAADHSADDHRGEALLGLGRCRLLDADFAGARHLLDEARQYFTHHPANLLHGLGAVALAEGDPAEALISFRDAEHANPSHQLQTTLQADIHAALQALRPDFTRPASFDSTADLLTTLTDLKRIATSEPRLEPFLPRIQDLIETLDRPLSVAILGEFNAGKSTLINALLGEEVVPMGVLPTTAHPCIMAYGPRKGARIVYNDGHLQDVDFATARRLMKEDAEEIRRLEYTYPHPELRSLNYWDTPGFNALDDRHESLATEALGQAEAILWLLDANQALKETEFALLDTLDDAPSRVLLVLNKIDRLGDPQTRQEPLNEILAYLQDNVGDQVLDILAISALEALNADDPTADFTRLLHLLDRQFAQRSWEIKISEVSRNLDDLLLSIDELRQRELLAYQDLESHAEALTALITDAHNERADQRQRFLTTFQDRLDFLLHGLDHEISDALRRRGKLIRRFVLDDEDQTYILELFKERLDHLLDHFQRQLLRDITHLEARLATALSPILTALAITDARPLRRRMEGFFDETRNLKTALNERVFGLWRARALGQISTGGAPLLEEISNLGPDATSDDRQTLLHTLLPPIDADFKHHLTTWDDAYFTTALRFTRRIHRDLATLKLEVRHRLDLSPQT